ncbi:oxidoreductase [Christensenellaceae bacterium]|nr:oxidoreductase [Christensenellaceae bacterium]BDF62325.1 oxidoreductase [Christensenellaceae bacterium]
MKAVKITGKAQVEVQEVPIPEPGEGEVLIRLKASALCRSDLHRYHGVAVFEKEEEGSNITPGHEPCGVVEKLGPHCRLVEPGDRVAIYLAMGCGTCEHCLAGDVMLCKEFQCLGFDRNGAHADYVVIPEENCLPLPDQMDFITGALSTDVGGTLYTACKRLCVDGSKTVAVFGIGPMGCGGILMAKGFGATVIAVDTDEKRLALALELGADYIVNPKQQDSVTYIKQLTGGKGADVAIDCSGNSIGENNAIDCIKSRGYVGLIGENKECTINPADQFIRRLIHMTGCWYFNRADWEELSEFIIRKNIALKKICSNVFPIGEAAQAFELFDSHEAQKVVFVWD